MKGDKKIMSIGENLKSLRESKGLTQEELAKMVGVHRTMISQAERETKTLSIPLGQTITEVLGCTIYDLLDNKLQQAIK